MKPSNTSIFDYPELMAGGCAYVDKTDRLYELAEPQVSHIYCLLRPRRFGKSLTISTFKSCFQGRRVLFKGLKFGHADWDWGKEVYHVLHLDMPDAACTDAVQLNIKLNQVASRVNRSKL